MCLTLKCPWNVMYSILAGRFHTGKVLSWVSQRQSQPPASCWNQRNHKNVTASVIIPPCCLNACPEKKKRVRLPVSLSHALTHRQTYMYVCSCLQDKQILSGVAVQFANFPFSHIHTQYISPDKCKTWQCKITYTEKWWKPRAVGHTDNKRGCCNTWPASKNTEIYNILKTERHWMILRFTWMKMILQCINCYLQLADNIKKHFCYYR